MKKQIYIACPMTHVPKSHLNGYVRFIQSIGTMIEERGFAHAKYAFRDTDPSIKNLDSLKIPKYCYKKNAAFINSSICIIAETSYPSTGVGIELQIAEQHRIPIILICRKQIISKMRNKSYYLNDKRKYKVFTKEDGVSIVVHGLSLLKKEIHYKNRQDCIRKLERYLSTLV